MGLLQKIKILMSCVSASYNKTAQQNSRYNDSNNTSVECGKFHLSFSEYISSIGLLQNIVQYTPPHIPLLRNLPTISEYTSK
jgi:hypothetical protein